MPVETQKRARPKELEGILLNPHKGCATFQHFNGDPLYEGTRWSEAGPTEFPARVHEGVTPGYLPCTVVYCRWFWETFEPEEGKYDWTVVEKALETAAERGQTLQVRLMPHGSARQAAVPQWYRDKYPTEERITHSTNPPCNVPIYDSPEFLDKWGAVISEFGARFDSHLDLESVDVSFIGPWGEGAGECSDEAVDKIIGIYKAAHPTTPMMTMISGYKMTAGVKAGMGWRLDCFGDMGMWDRPVPREQWWTHHYDCYPREVCLCGAQDAWMRAPITFESCGVPMSWFNKDFDLNYILKQGLKFHGSVLMPKSCAIPESYMEPLAEFCDQIGYKYVLRQTLFTARPKAGGTLDCEVWIENVGIAPIYHRYDLAIRLTQGNRTYVHRSDADIRTWLPGDTWLLEEIQVPSDFEAGTVALHAALVHPEDEARRVKLANEGYDDDGWLPVGTCEIV